MPTTPANHGSPYPSHIAAAQTEWYIDSSAGSDTANGLTQGTALRTDRERAKRVGDIPMVGAVVMYLVNGLASDEYITIPAIGPLGSFTVRGMEQTPLATGTFTDATAASGNVSATVEDAATNWASYLKRRIRLVSGPNYGATAWIKKSLGGGVAEIGQAMIADPAGYSIVEFAAGDQYVVEYLPDVPSIRFPYPIAISSYNPSGVTVIARAMLIDIGIDGDALTQMCVPHVGGQSAVQFFGCTLGQIDGTYDAIGCAFQEGISWTSGVTVLAGCVIYGSPTIGHSAASSWGYTSVVGGVTSTIAGKLLLTADCGFSYASTDGLTVDVGGLVVCGPNARLYGADNTLYGLRIANSAVLGYDYTTFNVPTITGIYAESLGGQLIVSGTTYGWGTILYGGKGIDSVDGGRIVAIGPGPNGVALATPFVPCVTLTSILPTKVMTGVICQVGINGPSLVVPTTLGVGLGWNGCFLQPFVYDGSHGIHIEVEAWVGTSKYFTICDVLIQADMAEGQNFALGAAFGYVFSAGVGWRIVVRVTNTDPLQTIDSFAAFMFA